MTRYCIKIKVWGLDWICFFPYTFKDVQLISEVIADDLLAGGDEEKIKKVFFDSRAAAEEVMNGLGIENEMEIIEKTR